MLAANNVLPRVLLRTTIPGNMTEQNCILVSAHSLGVPKTALLVLLVCIIYTHTLADLAKDWWTEPSLSYGMLMPPLAGYIAWLSRKVTFAIPKCPDGRGLLLVAVACCLYILGMLGSEFFLPRISAVLLLAGLVWTFWGVERLRSLMFPLLLLATMVPLPTIVYNALAAPLQLWASSIATSIAQTLGTSAYRDGNIILLANMSLGVEEACSGLSALSSLIIASIVLGFIQLSRPFLRWALVLISMPLAIAVNVIRVGGTAILADHHREFAEGFYHSFSGWLVFVCGLGGLYLISTVMQHVFESPRVER